MAAIGRGRDNALISRLMSAARGGGVHRSSTANVGSNGVASSVTIPTHRRHPPPHPRMASATSTDGGGDAGCDDDARSTESASEALLSRLMTMYPHLPRFPLERHHFGRLTGGGLSSSSTHVGVDENSDGHLYRRRHHRRPPSSPDDAVVVATPSDFHSYLCDGIRRARERVILASLYVGVGSGDKCGEYHRNDDDYDESATSSRGRCREDELLMALRDATTSPSGGEGGGQRKVRVLLDANRALRMVSTTSSTGGGQSHGGDAKGGSDARRSNSADAVLSSLMRMHPHLARGMSRDDDDGDARGGGDGDDSSGSGVFLFPVNDHSRLLRGILPSPLDEVAGVFHMKAYIIDDELLLSGANLSEEYFDKRIDRYMLFTNGAGGLVDFYADLCNVLCEYAIRYDGGRTARGVRMTTTRGGLSAMMSTRDDDVGARKRKLVTSLTHIFDGRNHPRDPEINEKEVVAWAIPTIQIPTTFLDGPIMGVPSDADVTRNLLSTALECDVSASVRLSSAYLNPTREMMSILKMYGKRDNVGGAPYILTAGEVSHGFAPKTRGGDTTHGKKLGIVECIKAAIPRAFLTLAKETARSIVSTGGKILLYERRGWTFHAKGIWITADHDADNDDHVVASFRRCRDQRHPEIINNPSSLLATVVGSSNFGSRSENLDLESNCILIFNDSSGTDVSVKESVAAEWNELCEPSNELKDVGLDDDGNRITRVVLKLLKRYL